MDDRRIRAGRCLEILAVYGMLIASVVGLLNIESDDPNGHAVVVMGLGQLNHAGVSGARPADARLHPRIEFADPG
jgi:hypothetical protein